MRYTLTLMALLVFTACSSETKITSSIVYHTEEIDVNECCANVEGYTCYFGPPEYNHAELVRVSNDPTLWVQMSFAFVPGKGVALDCLKPGVYRLTWN